MGSALAKEFHSAGLHVIATARDTTKMADLAEMGIETLPLDVSSETSIKSCIEKVPRLDILVNNAGASYPMPLSDIDIAKAKKFFDVNVWGCIALTQAFLPLLLASPARVIVNHTSVGAGMALPFQGVYNAFKAALSMLSNTLQLELENFGIKLVQLRTGRVATNIVKNIQANEPKLPDDLIYEPAREDVEKSLRSEWVEQRGLGIPVEQWAKEVVADLLRENSPAVIWRGESAWMASFMGWMPTRWFDGMIKRMTGLGEIEKLLRKPYNPVVAQHE